MLRGLIWTKKVLVEMINKQFWKHKRVLITGHTGFKGSWLSLWLLNMGAEVIGLSIEELNKKLLIEDLGIIDNINHFYSDIRDLEQVARVVNEVKPDVVLHLAAQPLVRESYVNPIDTWETNVMGTLNILEAIRNSIDGCVCICITTDKVYKNNEWVYGYRENDMLGGYDPYSSSKAAAEIAISSWRNSYFNSTNEASIRVASARAGNVIGGGDWAENRIVPDIVRALMKGDDIVVRNPEATRPWQHVIEPLYGYLLLAEKLEEDDKFATSFNFGPTLNSNRSVKDLVETSLETWPGKWRSMDNINQPHEAKLLNLVIDKAYHDLKWKPKWDFEETVGRTINWYKSVLDGRASALDSCIKDLNAYTA